MNQISCYTRGNHQCCSYYKACAYALLNYVLTVSFKRATQNILVNSVYKVRVKAIHVFHLHVVTRKVFV